MLWREVLHGTFYSYSCRPVTRHSLVSCPLLLHGVLLRPSLVWQDCIWCLVCRAATLPGVVLSVSRGSQHRWPSCCDLCCCDLHRGSEAMLPSTNTSWRALRCGLAWIGLWRNADGSACATLFRDSGGYHGPFSRLETAGRLVYLRTAH